MRKRRTLLAVITAFITFYTLGSASARQSVVLIESTHKANFHIDGESSGLSSSKKAKFKVKAGKHNIKAEYMGFETQRFEVVAEEGKTVKYLIHMPKARMRREGMKDVKAGEFIMGISPKSIKNLVKKFGGTEQNFANATPKRLIKIPAFKIDKFEVTNGMYKKFVDATKHRKPKHWKGNIFKKGTESFPVVNVSYNDALAYAKWAKKRLPTEEEWEKAARGDNIRSGRIFPWGIRFKSYYANTEEDGHPEARKTGEYEKGKSPYGLYDMSGNVAEWTSSDYKPYPGNKDFPKIKGTPKTIRGGAFDSPRYAVMISFRDKLDADTVSSRVGFRCVQ